MIALVIGKLEAKKGRYVVINAGGIGFRIFVSAETLSKMPKVGQTACLHTHLYLRQDALELYGFLTEEELTFFEMLNAVSGVGPKAAMGILGVAAPGKIKEAIAEGDETLLTRVSGVGRKTASKILLELKEKVREELRYVGRIANVADSEVREALEALGYGERQVRDVLKRIPDSVKKVEERLREALRLLGR